MTKTTDLGFKVDPDYQPPAHDAGDPLWDPGVFNHMWRVAQAFAASQLVPEHLRGKPADCFIAIAMAKRSGQDPLVVLQSIHMIKGKAGWASQYLIARAKMAGMRIMWETARNGEIRANKRPIQDLAVTAYATVEGERVETTITTQNAIDEGWTSNPKYFTMTETMLQYRTATRLVRLYMPEILLGLPAVEEIETLEAETVQTTAAAAARKALRKVVQPPAELPEPAEDAEQMELPQPETTKEPTPAPVAEPDVEHESEVPDKVVMP